MVGDSASDIRAAKEAGVKSIAVGWGHQSAETLLRARPDILTHSPSELREAILKLTAKSNDWLGKDLPERNESWT
jgi:AHBA synthesis associated protein